MDKQDSTFKYHAFISYSHRDTKWAEWLHKGIERYKVPKQLVGQKKERGVVPQKLFPVFKDREELPSSADLGGVISDALENSAYLIVICSPAAAQSRWVNEEILSFKRMGKANRILAIIVDGEPNASELSKPEDKALECFPPGLRFNLGPDNEIDENQPAEPVAADARPDGDGRNDSLLKLKAGLLGVDYNDLKQREKIRKRRKRLLLGVLALTVLISLSGVWYYGFLEKQKEAWEKTKAILLNQSLQTQSLLDKNQPSKALVKMLFALPGEKEKRGRAVPREALVTLHRAIVSNNKIVGLVGHSKNINFIDFSPRGDRLLSVAGEGEVILWDVKSWSKVAQWDLPVGGKAWFNNDGSLINTYGVNGGSLCVYVRDAGTGKKTADITSLNGFRAVSHNPSFNRSFFLAQDNKGLEGKYVQFWNAETGEKISGQVPGDVPNYINKVATNGSIAVIPAVENKPVLIYNMKNRQTVQLESTLDNKDIYTRFTVSPVLPIVASISMDNKHVCVWDGLTGKLLHDLSGSGAVYHAQSLVFDLAGELLWVIDGNTVHELNLETGDIAKSNSLDTFSFALYGVACGYYNQVYRSFPDQGGIVFADENNLDVWFPDLNKSVHLTSEGGIYTAASLFTLNGRKLLALGTDERNGLFIYDIENTLSQSQSASLKLKTVDRYSISPTGRHRLVYGDGKGLLLGPTLSDVLMVLNDDPHLQAESPYVSWLDNGQSFLAHFLSEKLKTIDGEAVKDHPVSTLLWRDIKQKNPIYTTTDFNGIVDDIKWSKSQKRLALQVRGGKIIVLERTDNTVKQLSMITVPNNYNIFYKFDLAKSGQQLVLVQGNTVMRFDAATGEKELEYQIKDIENWHRPADIFYLAKDKQIAIRYDSQDTLILRAEDLSPIKSVKNSKAGFGGHRFFANGKYILMPDVSHDMLTLWNKSSLWDLSNWKRVLTLKKTNDPGRFYLDPVKQIFIAQQVGYAVINWKLNSKEEGNVQKCINDFAGGFYVDPSRTFLVLYNNSEVRLVDYNTGLTLADYPVSRPLYLVGANIDFKKMAVEVLDYKGNISIFPFYKLDESLIQKAKTEAEYLK